MKVLLGLSLVVLGGYSDMALLDDLKKRRGLATLSQQRGGATGIRTKLIRPISYGYRGTTAPVKKLQGLVPDVAGPSAAAYAPSTITDTGESAGPMNTDVNVDYPGYVPGFTFGPNTPMGLLGTAFNPGKAAAILGKGALQTLDASLGKVAGKQTGQRGLALTQILADKLLGVYRGKEPGNYFDFAEAGDLPTTDRGDLPMGMGDFVTAVTNAGIPGTGTTQEGRDLADINIGGFGDEGGSWGVGYNASGDWGFDVTGESGGGGGFGGGYDPGDQGGPSGVY